MAEELATPEVFTQQTQDLIGGIKAKPLAEREPEYQKAMAKMLPAQIQAGVNVKKAEIARDVDVKESVAREGQRLSEEQRVEQKGFAEKLDKYAPPTFQPSQEDLTTYAQLGSSIVTLGMILGGGGKVPAKAALASMTGMLNGWRTGRRELYERESKNFEKESQRLTAVRKSIQDDMNQAMSLWPTKRKDAMALIESARFKAGSDSVLGSMLYKGNYDGAMKLLESARKTDEAKLKDENALAAKKIDEAAKERRHREDMAQKERMQKELMLSREKIAAEKSGAKVSSIGKIAEGKLEAKSSLVKQYDSLIEEYETNKDKYKLSPALRTALSAVPGGGSVSEKMMSVARANPNKYPNVAALSQFIGKLETVIAPDRHSLYGANLTANELPRYERTIPKLTDDPEIFLKFLENNRKSALDSLNNSKDFYARRGVDLKLDDIYDRAQSFIDTKNVAAKFNTIEEAEAANLPVGTKIIVDGKSATVK